MIDKLILYGILVFIVSLLIAMIYRLYCIKKFNECNMRWQYHKDIIKPILSFSCWDLYGNMSVSGRQQGTTMLLNMFYGPALNAANGIANNVHGIILGFANNVITAFRPQIIKNYAEKDIVNMSRLVINASKFTLSLYLIVAIPLFLEAEYVLRLWLKTVPEHTNIFLRIILICSLFKLAGNILNIVIHATGRIKKFSFISGTIFLLNVPLLYILIKFNWNVNLAYCSLVPIDITILLTTLCVTKILVSQIKIKEIITKSYLPNIGMAIIISGLLYLIQCQLHESFLRLVIISFSSLILSLSYIYFILLNSNQRQSLLEQLKHKLHINSK